MNVPIIAAGPGWGVQELWRALSPHLREPCVVLCQGPQPNQEVVERLVDALAAPLAATASPLPVDDEAASHARTYELHERLPPPPSLPEVCDQLVAISTEALESARSALFAADDVSGGIVVLRDVLSRGGWRHVAAPGVALRWCWQGGDASPANESLATHRLWATTRLRAPRVLIDGACLDSESHTGTQLLVFEVARWMASVRPSVAVSLAVPRGQVAGLSNELAGTGVTVVARDRRAVAADVVYRPYQILAAGELRWLIGRAPRLVVSQLDMIGFSIADYHPAVSMFFSARNLQRWLMRKADAVTFISDFGRQTTIAECPDLTPERLHVVSCGADAITPRQVQRPELLPASSERFVLCLAATFWHKNRLHAIDVFAEMVERHHYEGVLVIAGPEPFYGRSRDAEQELIERRLPATAERVVHLGRCSEAEKWWLLENAELVLYPSIVEGFGLVPFEAAAAGTPCLARDATALGEVLGESKCLLDTWDTVEWAHRAHAAVTDAVTADQMVAAVRLAAAHFTWERSANLTWQAIDAVLAMPNRYVASEEGGALSKVAAPAGLARWVEARFFVTRALAAFRRRAAARLGRR